MIEIFSKISNVDRLNKHGNINYEKWKKFKSHSHIMEAMRTSKRKWSPLSQSQFRLTSWRWSRLLSLFLQRPPSGSATSTKRLGSLEGWCKESKPTYSTCVARLRCVPGWKDKKDSEEKPYCAGFMQELRGLRNLDYNRLNSWVSISYTTKQHVHGVAYSKT